LVFAVACALAAAPAVSAMPEILKWEPTPGVGIGNTFIHGTFSEFYKPSIDLNISLFTPLGKFNAFLLPIFSYGNFPFKADSTTKMTHYDLSLPLGVYFPLFRGISPFVAAGAEFSYYTLAAATTRENTSTYRIKPIASAGIFIPVTYYAFISVSARYSYTQLSGEAFSNTTFSAALTVSYPTWRRNEEAVQAALAEKSRELQHAAEIETLMKDGKNLLEEEKYDEAEQKFRNVLALKKDHPEARKNISRAKALPFLREARIYKEEGKGLSAIRSYEKAAASLEEAATELAEYRAQLKGTIPALATSATQAYDSGQYNNAILLFEKIQAIEPDNETVKIYLPRARNRQKALEKMR